MKIASVGAKRSLCIDLAHGYFKTMSAEKVCVLLR